MCSARPGDAHEGVTLDLGTPTLSQRSTVHRASVHTRYAIVNRSGSHERGSDTPMTISAPRRGAEAAPAALG
ncbi:hypothetical protein [Alloactinosynnema sp. L-07]|nr:hypothetical protein [Alloactinosynnema sp. L-07]